MSRILLLPLSLLLVTACQTVDNVPPEPRVISDGPATTIVVRLDSRFSGEQIDALHGILREWSRSTSERVEYASYVAEYDPGWRSREVDGTYSVIASRPDDPSLEGWASWNLVVPEGRHSAFVEIDPRLPEEEFRLVALHEIGHANGLEHYYGPYRSIMKVPPRETSDIGCADLIAFCRWWSCRTTCSPSESE